MAGRSSYLLDGQRVAQARIALRVDGGRPPSQQDVADLCGIHRVTLAKIEAGDARVSLEVLERLASQLGRSREWLLGEPEHADDLLKARERVATALSKIGEGFEDFTAAVDELYARVADAKTDAAKTPEAVR